MKQNHLTIPLALQALYNFKYRQLDKYFSLKPAFFAI